MTKGQMIKFLKENGVRKGNKNGAMVQLEHLRTADVIKLYYQFCK